MFETYRISPIRVFFYLESWALIAYGRIFLFRRIPIFLRAASQFCYAPLCARLAWAQVTVYKTNMARKEVFNDIGSSSQLYIAACGMLRMQINSCERSAPSAS